MLSSLVERQRFAPAAPSQVGGMDIVPKRSDLPWPYALGTIVCEAQIEETRHLTLRPTIAHRQARRALPSYPLSWMFSRCQTFAPDASSRSLAPITHC